MKTKAELQKQINELQKEIDNFVEPKQELEVGKWYKLDGVDDCIVNYVGNSKGYGLSIAGNWGDEIYVYEPSGKWTLATEKEVETALIKEAKKRGFKEGVKFKGFDRDIRVAKKWKNRKEPDFDYYYGFGLTFLCGDNNGCSNPYIFKDGKWAEIIEDSKPTINGYEMEVDGDVIKFGCQKFDITEVRKLSRLLNDNDSGIDWITSFKIFGNGPSDYYEISVKQLKEVVDYLNK